jgi:hypothetical protein
MRIPKTTLTFVTFALLLLVALEGGCRGSRGGGGTGPLPTPPPPDQLNMSNNEPQKG